MPDSESPSKKLGDLVAQQLFGYKTLEQANDDEAQRVRSFLKDFEYLAGNLSQVYSNIQNDIIDNFPQQKRALDFLVEQDETFLQSFYQAYANTFYALNGGLFNNDTGAKQDAQVQGYQLASILRLYGEYVQRKDVEKNGPKSIEDQIQDQINKMGDYKAYLDFLDTHRRVQERLGLMDEGGNPTISTGKWRNDTPPEEIESWECRIGASKFYVPPTSISVIQNHKTSSLAGAALRQPNSPKINLGHSETTIMMTIYFPTHETIWGFDGDQPDWQFHNWDPISNVPQETGYHNVENSGALVPDRVIDNYLSSLRGLITQFKYMPFLPVSNAYLNRAHDIDAVVMKNMTVSTVENYPFVAAVTLEMSKFNYNPYLPMIDHFDQAIHWGKFRQMAGRCAANLQSRVNKSFLVTETWRNNGQQGVLTKRVGYEGEYTPTLDKGREIIDGRYFDIYFPTTTPSRIFAADTTDFRQPGEDEFFTRDYWDFIIGDLGFVATEAPDFNFFEYDDKRKFQTNEREILRTWLGYNVDIWQQMNKDKYLEFLDQAIADGFQNGTLNAFNKDVFESRLKFEWFYVLFDEILTNDPVFKKIKSARESAATDYVIREWEVPMARVDIDWSSCIVTGVGVSLSNKFASLQLQLQDEPTYQHIGGGDSMIDVEMTVLGEDNIIALRRVFQHINGLARIERAHGVLGFLGIKNVFTALCGIKYVLPISFEVDTKPNYPNVYTVRLSFVDFDVMQQQRERLDSSQQRELIELFGKANPFLRIKQSWGQINCYPDFPLDIRDDEGNVLGHLDPDWYFRSFTKNNTDLVEWSANRDILTTIQEYVRLSESEDNHEHGYLIRERLDELRRELREATANRIQAPVGWSIGDDGVPNILSEDQYYDPNKREYRYYLGAYGENQRNIAIIDMFQGGVFVLGHQDTETGEVVYITDYSMLSEDLATKNVGNISIEGTVPLPSYQQEYLDGKANPNFQYEMMMKDWDYRSINGRMIKAFPTYMLWLIDEGGRFAGIKLFDNLYGLNSIIDFSVSQSAADPISDTLVLRLSNIYQKLTRPLVDGLFSEDDLDPITGKAKDVATLYDRAKNINSGLFDSLIEIDNIRLKPGVRVHLRAGWGNNPNALQTIFNGTITEVEAGPVMTVIAQSDAVELSAYVNSSSTKDHSGKLDGALNNFWLSEPRDLMVRLLSMGSSNFKEWLAWGSKGVMFSESRFGIRHFGNILYEPMSQPEVDGTFNMQATAHNHVKASGNVTSGATDQLNGLLGDGAGVLSELNSIKDFGPSSELYGILGNMAQALWTNSFQRRDYEVFKRNIYPGNGTGIAQYMGGDLLDAGILVTQAGTLYDEDTTVNSDPQLNRGVPARNENDITPGDLESNQDTIKDFWEKYYKEEGISEEELASIFESAETSPAIEINNLNRGFLDSLFEAGKDTVGFGLTAVPKAIDWQADLFDVDLGLINLNQVVMGPALASRNLIKAGTGIINGLVRVGGSPFGKALGLSQIISDDDIEGFEEVAFRAQTYMKTVWDLFEVCAALLPNYIVAVRPFEDGSTVFYGKPHWLYTSGVIPVTTGVQTEVQSKLLEPDEIISGIMGSLGGGNVELDRMMNTVRQTGALKDVEAFLLKNYDPYNVSSVAGDVSLINDESIQQAFATAIEKNENDNLDIISGFKSIDYSQFTDGELAEIATYTELLVGVDNGEILSEIFQDQLKERSRFLWAAAGAFKEEYDKSDGAPQLAFEKFVEVWAELKKAESQQGSDTGSVHDYSELMGQIEKDKGLTPDQKINLKKLLNTDPITFSYQFGWRYSAAPVYVGPEANYGYDVIGEAARQRYDETYSRTVDVIGGNSGRTLSEAYDIWSDFRRVYEYRPEIVAIYKKVYPWDTEGENYSAWIDAFYRFLWQDPWNRAWLVLKPDRQTTDGPRRDGYYTETQLFDGTSYKIDPGGSRKWTFEGVDGAWETFLAAKDLTFDSNQVPRSGSTKAWMRANAQEGSSASTVFGEITTGVSDWFDENIGQVLGLVIDSITGLVASIRLSLAQLSQGLNIAAEFQRQANVLNAVLMDSIYYQMGGDDEPLLRLVDNPYTRQYNEPVVEIREPFQRVHMVSSMTDILSNQIRENLNGVSTVITAVSDGKNPVTVHFDKGVPPERQIETSVETGLYWDNALGSGIFGFLQPLIHPLESIRGFKKTIEGTSDQLSARRIALYHLKKNLKNIYEGEIILLGNTDIRPHDLLFISDNYERIFGMVEVGQVIHHFTPETGFITSVTPDALVTINDPGRWTMMSYLANKLMNNSVRDEMRALMNIGIDRFVAQGLDAITSEELENQFSDHIAGAVQWTQGSTALVRDLGAVFAGGGIEGLNQREKVQENIVKLDLGLAALKPLSGVVGGAAGLIMSGGNPLGAAIGVGGGYAVGDLAWEAWQWVKDNLLDQHGCYISYLNKEGQAMDAGLSYFQGTAVGSNHSLSLFPAVFGIEVLPPRIDVKEDGHFRITTNDLLANLGWTEVETMALYRDTSLFVNMRNIEVLDLAGRGPNIGGISNDNFEVFYARLLPREEGGIEDGDTLKVRVLDPLESNYSNGQVVSIRISAINTAELPIHDNPNTDYNEALGNDPNDLGYLAYQYLLNKYSLNDYRNSFAVRVRKDNRTDDYGRTIGTIFHNAPITTPVINRKKVLVGYASANPPIPMQAYLSDGRPYTLNWELVMVGYGNVDMRESLWETDWRSNALND